MHKNLKNKNINLYLNNKLDKNQLIKLTLSTLKFDLK